jgi:hypothetical protein
LHQLWVVVTVLAYLGGATLQAMPLTDLSEVSVKPATMTADMPCDQMNDMTAANGPSDHTPCKGITPDCIKQMGCIGVLSLPHTAALATPVAYATVDYWAPLLRLGSLPHKPALFPPIAS